MDPPQAIPILGQMEGTFIDIENPDYLLSQNIFRNVKITDSLMSFWYKARHNVLPCHYTLFLWYPEHAPDCHLNQYKLERMAHILNGCKEINNNYSKRYDYVVEKIASELKPHCNDIYINKTVRSAFPDTTVESRVLDLKPDIL